jgi:predicted HTH transcriptional regulator
MAVSIEELIDIFSLPHEFRHVEFKEPGKPEGHFLIKIIKVVLGMANSRDGGKIIIGVREDSNGNLEKIGLDENQLLSWKYDDLAAQVFSFSDPSVDFQMESIEHEKKKYIVLSVDEFRDVPIICKKEFIHQDSMNRTNKIILRKGACYVRPGGKPETVEIPNQEEMRNLLDLATEKRLKYFLSMGKRAGLNFSELFLEKNHLNEARMYREQIRDLIDEQ